VESRLQRWVYRTDLSGTRIKLDLAASRVLGKLIQPPGQIPESEMPQPIPANMRFRMLSQGGLLNRRVETWLESDGRIMQTRSDAKGEQQTRQLRQLKPEVLAQFEQLLLQRQFSRFNQVNYPPPQGAADFFQIVLSASGVSVRYTDSNQAQLPEDMQQVIRAWDNLVQTGQLVSTPK
jgi:hypothetical protein